MGFSTWDMPEVLKSYRIRKKDNRVYLTRGTLKRVITIMTDYGHEVELIDRRMVVEKVKWHDINCAPRDEQPTFLKLFKDKENGIIIAYTSFGKSLCTLMAIREIGMPALIMMHTTDYQKQWFQEATDPKAFNMPKKDIGGVGGMFSGKKRKFGKINLGLYHSLSNPEHLKFFSNRVGVFVMDEVQKAPIEACRSVVDKVPAKYRIGMSAEIKRKDKKEFLTIDSFGEPIKRFEEKESQSKIKSKITLIPTEYEDEDYEFDKNNVGLETRASMDSERNSIILKRTIRKLQLGKIVLIIVPRKYQAFRLFWKLNQTYRVKLLVGNVNKDDIPEQANPDVAKFMLEYKDNDSYEICKELAERKELDVIIGTQKAEVGISITTIDHIVIGSMATGNYERFNQIVGRVERKYKAHQVEAFGHEKPVPTVEALWDKKISSRKGDFRTLKSKYGKRIKVLMSKGGRND